MPRKPDPLNRVCISVKCTHAIVLPCSFPAKEYLRRAFFSYFATLRWAIKRFLTIVFDERARAKFRKSRTRKIEISLNHLNLKSIIVSFDLFDLDLDKLEETRQL